MKVEQLITNPKKSIIGLSIPMILSLFLTMVNNLADAMWVSGLGADALAAIGVGESSAMALAIENNGIVASNNLNDIFEICNPFDVPIVTVSIVLSKII